MVVMRKEDGTENELVCAQRVSYCRGEGLFPVAALGVEGCERKYQNGQTGTHCGRIFSEKHGEETKKREEWCGSRGGVKRMVFCGLMEGLVIRTMRRGGMLIM